MVVIERDPSLPITWVDFRDEFLDKYFPADLYIQKENEFANLTQGQLSVSEYEARFIKLSEFAPKMMPTDTARVQ